MTCSGKRLFISVKTTMCKKHNYHNLENCQHVLMMACLGDDIIPDDLRSQLTIFGQFSNIPDKEKPATPTIFEIKEYFAKLSIAQTSIF